MNFRPHLVIPQMSAKDRLALFEPRKKVKWFGQNKLLLNLNRQERNLEMPGAPKRSKRPNMRSRVVTTRRDAPPKRPVNLPKSFYPT